MNASPRLKRVLKYQFVAMIFNLFLMAWASLWLVDTLLPQLAQEGGVANFMLRFAATAGLTALFTTWLNNISLVLINMVVYAGNLEEAAEEAIIATLPTPTPQTPATEQVDFLIIDKPERPVASYQGAEIFEWLDVQGEDGTRQRLHFDGTVDMKRGLPSHLAPGTLLLPPGILYTAAPQ